MIKGQIIGHLGKDATLNKTDNMSVINFSVCHSENWTDKQGVKQSRSVWMECSYWTEKTAILPYLKKGTQVFVEGIPGGRIWIGNDGKSNLSLTLRVGTVQLLSSAKEEESPLAAVTAGEVDNSLPADDLPF